MRIARGYCYTCSDYKKIQGKKLSHLLHIFLCVISAGFWGFVYGWLLVTHSGSKGKWICSECGGKAEHEKYKSLIEWKSEQRIPTFLESRQYNEAYKKRRAWKKRGTTE